MNAIAAVFAARSAARISHLQAMLLFAFFLAIALACISPERSTMVRLKYAARTFLLFVAIAVGIAWLMYPFSR